MAERANPNPTPDEDPAALTFEDALARVEDIIERIDSGEAGLEEALKDYERGVALMARCKAILDRAEQKVADLTAQMERDAADPPSRATGGDPR
ncbi:MAG: exodeoxyribonuclease VII small subunit [Phycisphaerae bacterium]|nr:exodeoxyribonuclease VII small subunit [Phycisphaerae bacterium]